MLSLSLSVDGRSPHWFNSYSEMKTVSHSDGYLSILFLNFITGLKSTEVELTWLQLKGSLISLARYPCLALPKRSVYDCHFFGVHVTWSFGHKYSGF